jgi:antitoxin ParD1/3/4
MPRQLTPQHEAVVDRIVASGRYDDPDQVIDEALHLLEERQQRLESLRAELQIGLDQEARGELIDWTPDFMEQLMQEADERSRLGLPVKDAVKP